MQQNATFSSPLARHTRFTNSMLLSMMSRKVTMAPCSAKNTLSGPNQQPTSNTFLPLKMSSYSN